MAETRWTPGPWRIGTRYQDENDVFGLDGFSVASVHVNPTVEWPPDDVHPSRLGPEHTRELTEEAWAANAALIAAAPELYRELAGLVDVLERLGRLDSPRVISARAALAKARGE